MGTGYTIDYNRKLGIIVCLYVSDAIFKTDLYQRFLSLTLNFKKQLQYVRIEKSSSSSIFALAFGFWKLLILDYRVQ